LVRVVLIRLIQILTQPTGDPFLSSTMVRTLAPQVDMVKKIMLGHILAMVAGYEGKFVVGVKRVELMSLPRLIGIMAYPPLYLIQVQRRSLRLGLYF